MKKIIFFSLILSVLVACKDKDADTTALKTFIFTGTVTNDETGQPEAGVWLYLHHGRHTCCIGPNAATAKLDSTKTDASGKFSLTIERPRDTSINYAYVFDNYVRNSKNNPFVTISTSFNTFPVVNDFKDSLHVDHKQIVNMTVLKAARVEYRFLDTDAPVGDSVFVDLKNGYAKTEFNRQAVAFGISGPNFYTYASPVFNLLSNRQTIITVTAKQPNGTTKIRRDTFSNIPAGDLVQRTFSF
jgi:hypothetical protein